MPSRTLPGTTIGSLLAAVWVASALAAWAMPLRPDETGLVLVIVFFFRFVPMVTTIGALFGRPAFGAVLAILTLVALAGIEMANILIGVA